MHKVLVQPSALHSSDTVVCAVISILGKWSPNSKVHTLQYAYQGAGQPGLHESLSQWEEWIGGIWFQLLSCFLFCFVFNIHNIFMLIQYRGLFLSVLSSWLGSLMFYCKVSSQGKKKVKKERLPSLLLVPSGTDLWTYDCYKLCSVTHYPKMKSPLRFEQTALESFRFHWLKKRRRSLIVGVCKPI